MIAAGLAAALACLAVAVAAATAGRDRARGLLAVAVRRLPAHRRDWGRAMLAEYEHVVGRGARWRFVLGCVRVAVLTPPRPGRRTGLRAGLALAVAAAVGAGVAAVSPLTRAFGVLLAVGTLVAAGSTVLGSGRPVPAGDGRAVWAVRAAILAGVAGCVAVAVYGVHRWPFAGADPGHWYALVLAALLTGYGRLAVTATRAVRAHTSGWAGVAAGPVVGGLWVVGVAAPRPGPVTALCWLLALAGAAGLGAAVSRPARDARAGIAAGMCGGLLGGLLTFGVGMSVLYARPDWFADAGAAGRYQASGAPDLTSYLVSDYLGGSIALLLVVPAITVAFAAAGAALTAGPARITPASPAPP